MTTSSAAVRREQRLVLPDLPVELLQKIAFHLDVATFYISFLLCRKFTWAVTDRLTILHHLENLPGVRQDWEPFTTQQLLKHFRKRAADSLCGAGLLANIKFYTPSRCGVQSQCSSKGGDEIVSYIENTGVLM